MAQSALDVKLIGGVNKASVPCDEEVNKRLQFIGWRVIRFWGKDIKKNTADCVKVVEEVIYDQMHEIQDDE